MKMGWIAILSAAGTFLCPSVTTAADRIILQDDFVLEAYVAGYDELKNTVILQVQYTAPLEEEKHEGKAKQKNQETAPVMVVRYGTLEIPASRVKRILFDEKEKSRPLPAEADKLAALAVFLEQKADGKASLFLARRIKGEELSSAEDAVRLARMCRRAGDEETARRLLQQFLSKHPLSPLVSIELQNMGTSVKTTRPRKTRPSTASHPEGLEAGKWRVEPWGNKGTVSSIRMNDDLLLSLRITDSSKKDKFAVKRDMKANERPAGTNRLSIDVYNAMKEPVRMAVAFVTMPGWKYFESTPMDVPPRRWVRKTVNMKSGKFKSAETEWKFSASIANPDTVRQLIILFYTKQTGSIFVNNVQFVH